MSTTRSPHRAVTPAASDLELVAAAQAGDPDAFDALVDRYRRFVRFRSRGYFLMGGDRDDLEQEALIGFYKAVRDFDPELRAAFRSFAELCITRQIITAVKAATRKKHVPLNDSVSFSAPREDDDRPGDDRFVVDDRQAGPLEQLVAGDDLASTHQALTAALSPLELDVLTRFVDGASYEVIAADLGRHAKAVDNALQRIKRKVTQCLDDRAELEAVA